MWEDGQGRAFYNGRVEKGWASLVAQRLKRLPAMWETWVQSLGLEDSLEKEMATNSSILVWRIPWTEEPGCLHSMGSQSVGYEWALHFQGRDTVCSGLYFSRWLRWLGVSKAVSFQVLFSHLVLVIGLFYLKRKVSLVFFFSYAYWKMFLITR